jgi:hypothetical protein
MKKRDVIIYWIATLWLSLGMVSTGVVQLIRMPEEVERINRLGYPVYFLTLIGVWKMLGVVAVLMPKLALLKEWAYAGFFFAMTGAIISHVAMNDPASELFGPSLLVVLTVTSWYFRPQDRRVPLALA